MDGIYAFDIRWIHLIEAAYGSPDAVNGMKQYIV